MISAVTTKVRIIFIILVAFLADTWFVAVAGRTESHGLTRAEARFIGGACWDRSASAYTTQLYCDEMPNGLFVDRKFLLHFVVQFSLGLTSSDRARRAIAPTDK